MNAQLMDGTDGIVAKFADWVKSLSAEFAGVNTPEDALQLEERIRCGGREILLCLLEERLQRSIQRSQEKLRECPGCGGRRRHRGTRRRRLDSSLGSMELEGIYWQCPDCGESRHAVDLVAEERLSGLFKEMVLLLGVSCSSFAKSQLLAEKLLGVQTDDDTIVTLSGGSASGSSQATQPILPWRWQLDAIPEVRRPRPLASSHRDARSDTTAHTRLDP
jgi:hypothetical protein